MARLTEEMVIARSKQSDLSVVKKLNCWGAELGDVSLLRRMPNVEVLAFSINKIRGLADFAGCRRLRELYVRKNEIRDLAEIRHLKHLPDLTSLWLDENPCTHTPQYRMTVLRNLPNLEKLDNIDVHPEEVQEAMRRGVHIPDSDDEGYPQQHWDIHKLKPKRASALESFSGSGCGNPRSSESSPERDTDHYYRRQRIEQGSDGSVDAETVPEPTTAPTVMQRPVSLPEEERYERVMSASHYEPRGPRSPDAPSLRHSVSAHSVKEYAMSNGEWRGNVDVSAHQHEMPAACCDRSDRSDRSEYWKGEWERGDRCERVESEREGRSGRERERQYPSAVMGSPRGFTRRPVTRNSNLLSAVLCLVRELDYPCLEVAEMAVRCRMDELVNEQ